MTAADVMRTCDDNVRRDGLLVDASVLDVDAASGTECVWWKRNLPCCGFRDYVFGRRTWRQGDNRYTVCKVRSLPVAAARCFTRRMYGCETERACRVLSCRYKAQDMVSLHKSD